MTWPWTEADEGTLRPGARRAAESREVSMSTGREELARFMKKFNSLHATTDLPEKISDRVGVRWFFSVNQL